MAPNRLHVIIWINGDQVSWRIYASLGLNELNKITFTGKKFLDIDNWAILVRRSLVQRILILVDVQDVSFAHWNYFVFFIHTI